MAPEPAPAPRFEDEFRRLEELVRSLEQQDLSLDESIARYEQGIACWRRCLAILAEAERRIEQVVASADGTEEIVPFEPGA